MAAALFNIRKTIIAIHGQTRGFTAYRIEINVAQLGKKFIFRRIAKM